MPSSVIKHIDYDAGLKILTVVFQSGKVYYYKNVPQGAYLSLKTARSKGAYLNKCIKGVYEYESSDLD
ncbi:KTSC domain-containing protein [Pedobacter faecalis]|uniref:KTSC domain-containing protein n=1 Tax=Pedobacter faecalis TaxID=3041495 RepID=UPI00254F0175|nr:KTSC domain-containing protein [Pedobacter sp. ELA7]